MYNPPAFREDDTATLHAHISASGLAMVVSNGASGVPDISYLPLVLLPQDGPQGSLLGHFARANGHWKALAGRQAVVIFPGANAYVSPSWYPTKQVHHKHVPTWNYETVHATGTVEIFEEKERLRETVRSLTRRHEEHRAEPWRIEQAPMEYMDAMLRSIVGFKLRIEALAGKRKLSQNRAPEDKEGVRQALAASPAPQDQAVARLMDGG